MNHRDFIYFLNFVCLVCSMAVAGALVGWGDWEKATFALVAAVFFPEHQDSDGYVSR